MGYKIVVLCVVLALLVGCGEDQETSQLRLENARLKKALAVAHEQIKTAEMKRAKAQEVTQKVTDWLKATPSFIAPEEGCFEVRDAIEIEGAASQKEWRTPRLKLNNSEVRKLLDVLE